jgi:hypothetical protein
MHMFGWFFIKCGLLGMIHMTCGPLEGVLVCLCRTFLVGYWFATRILLSVKVKVLRGGISAYGWVTILLYCLWLNEHTHFINRLWAHTSFVQSNHWKEAKP